MATPIWVPSRTVMLASFIIKRLLERCYAKPRYGPPQGNPHGETRAAAERRSVPARVEGSATQDIATAGSNSAQPRDRRSRARRPDAALRRHGCALLSNAG